jgi:hypothetical protein
MRSFVELVLEGAHLEDVFGNFRIVLQLEEGSVTGAQKRHFDRLTKWNSMGRLLPMPLMPKVRLFCVRLAMSDHLK